MNIEKKTLQPLIIIQIIALIIFVTLNLGITFSKGVCCADDGAHAQVAKNLANGIGYASTLPFSQVHYKVTQFDPEMGSGPTIILPAALIIKLFGNTYWVPGLAEVIIWSILLLITGFILNKMVENKLGLTIATLIFFFFCYAFTAYHSEEWWALLGEIPAVLLIILAILVYFFKDSKDNLLITGLLFSFAYQAKVIALLPFGVFLLAIIASSIIKQLKKGKNSYTLIFTRLLLIGVGFLIPTLLFELWKLAILKTSGYLEWWSRFLMYFSSLSINTEQSLLQKMLERIGTARERFGFSLPILFIVLPGIGWVIRKENKLFQIFLVLALIICVYTVYWLFFSIGWARYYIIPLIIIVFVSTFPFLSRHLSKRIIFIYAIILVAISIYNIKSININYPLQDINLFKPNAKTLAQKEVVGILANNSDRKPFYTQWWATAVDLEYLLDTHLNFDTVYDPVADFTKPFIVIVNKGFLLPDLPEVSEILLKCKSNEIGQYIYAECPPQISP